MHKEKTGSGKAPICGWMHSKPRHVRNNAARCLDEKCLRLISHTLMFRLHIWLAHLQSKEAAGSLHRACDGQSPLDKPLCTFQGDSCRRPVLQGDASQPWEFSGLLYVHYVTMTYHPVINHQSLLCCLPLNESLKESRMVKLSNMLHTPSATLPS